MIINVCPLCEGEGFISISKKNKEEIVKCSCGVVYKRRVDPDKKCSHYSNVKIWDKDFFEKRYKKISEYLAEKIGNCKEKILDIGSGNGRMLYNLRKVFNANSFYAVEPSKNLHATIEKMNFNLYKERFDSVKIKDKFDLIVCMGVDYLFISHEKAMRKIQTLLNSGGFLYIERNVFAGMSAFVGHKNVNIDYLYWNNSLITTWFTKEQMETQIKKYFKIIDSIEYGEEVSEQKGWLCSLK